MARFFVPHTAITLAGVLPERMANATGLSNFIRILGAGFGTAIGVTMWDRRQWFHYSRLSEHVTSSNPGLEGSPIFTTIWMAKGPFAVDGPIK